MKRVNEFATGLVILIAVGVVLGGAWWLSEQQFGLAEVVTVRFRTLGSLGIGDPVVLRGVRVGRVEAVRLADDAWVEADLQIHTGVMLPPNPAVIASPSSLFGEWTAVIISLQQPPDDPNVRRMLDEAGRAGSGALPGATLPDIGQLTAEASRIATDIAAVTQRVQETFDSTAVNELRGAISDFGQVSDRIVQVTNEQAAIIGAVGNNMERGSAVLADAATYLQSSLARVDSATNEGQLQAILNNVQNTSNDMRVATGDLRSLLSAAQQNQQSLVRILVAADTLMARIQHRSGSLGLLVGDSTLYREAAVTLLQLQQLIADIQANPRKYFKFSVF